MAKEKVIKTDLCQTCNIISGAGMEHSWDLLGLWQVKWLRVTCCVDCEGCCVIRLGTSIYCDDRYYSSFWSTWWQEGGAKFTGCWQCKESVGNKVRNLCGFVKCWVSQASSYRKKYFSYFSTETLVVGPSGTVLLSTYNICLNWCIIKY